MFYTIYYRWGNGDFEEGRNWSKSYSSQRAEPGFKPPLVKPPSPTTCSLMLRSNIWCLIGASESRAGTGERGLRWRCRWGLKPWELRATLWMEAIRQRQEEAWVSGLFLLGKEKQRRDWGRTRWGGLRETQRKTSLTVKRANNVYNSDGQKKVNDLSSKRLLIL